MTLRHPQLLEIERQLDEASARASSYASVDAPQFFERPAEHSWSAGECIGHLNLTTAAFVPLMRTSLQVPDGGAIEVHHRYRQNVAGWLLAWLLEPPFRMRVKTPRSFEPVEVGTRDEVVRAFRDGQQTLGELLEACDLRDLERHKIASPFDRRVSYNLYSAFRIMLAHQRRHLWQADRARGIVAHRIPG